MFGQNKPTFGTSAFGSTSTGGGLFGQNKTVGFATTQSGGLFGSTSATTTGGGLFGQSNTGGTGGGLFGSSGSTFGQPAASTGGGLFGQSGTSAFGASTSGGGGLFGQSGGGTSGTTGGGLFGSSATTGGGLFGATAQNGTTIKFDPLISQDTMMRNNTQTSIQTKHQCITAMKQYENKSLEELRVEDYMANRKGAQAGSTTGTFGASTAGGGLFGGAATSAAPSGGGLFGQQSQAKPLFGFLNPFLSGHR